MTKGKKVMHGYWSLSIRKTGTVLLVALCLAAPASSQTLFGSMKKQQSQGGEVKLGSLVPYEQVVQGNFAKRQSPFIRYQTYMLDGTAGETITIWVGGETNLHIAVKKQNMMATEIGKSEAGTHVDGSHKLSVTFPGNGRYFLQLFPGKDVKSDYTLLVTRSAAATMTAAMGGPASSPPPQEQPQTVAAAANRAVQAGQAPTEPAAGPASLIAQQPMTASPEAGKQNGLVPGFRIQSTVHTKGAPTQKRTLLLAGARHYMKTDQMVMLMQCDQNRYATINPKNGKYVWSDIKPAVEPPAGAARLDIVVDVQDTGERKPMFGLEARRLKIRSTTTPSVQACGTRTEIEHDGWYVDLPGYDPGCVLTPEPVTIGGTTCHFHTRVTGSEQMGYVVAETLRTKVMGHSVETRTETTELKQEPLPATLFEIEPGLQQASSVTDLWTNDPGPLAQNNPSGKWKFMQLLLGAAVETMAARDPQGAAFASAVTGQQVPTGSSSFAQNLTKQVVKEAAGNDPNAAAMLNAMSGAASGRPLTAENTLRGVTDTVVQQATGTSLTNMKNDPARATAEMAAKQARDQQARQSAAQQATPPASPMLAAPPAGGTALPGADDDPMEAAAGTDGTYATTDNNYRIDVRFSPGKLTVVEPNKTSDYRQGRQSNVFEFVNPSNGIAYSLKVVDRQTLHAFKPDTPSNITVLKLVAGTTPKRETPPAATPVAAAPAPTARPAAALRNASATGGGLGKQAADCKPGVLEVFLMDSDGNRQRALVKKEFDDPAFALSGFYKNEGQGHPYVDLGPHGFGGYFEMHGAPRPGNKYGIEEWWLQANCDGTLLKRGGREQQGARGAVYTLVLKFSERGNPYQGSYWNRNELSVSYDRNMVYINGERQKGALEGGSGVQPAGNIQTVPMLVDGERPAPPKKPPVAGDGSMLPKAPGSSVGKKRSGASKQ